MEPFTLQALLALLGGNVAGNTFFADRTAQDSIRRAQRLTSPEAFTGLAEKLYSLLAGSPIVSSAERSVLAGSNQANSAIRQALASRGILKSGLGAVGTGVGASLAGSGIAKLRTGLFSKAMTDAMRLLELQVGAASSLPQNRNIGRDVFAGSLDLLPLLLQGRQPSPGRNPSSTSVDDFERITRRLERFQ